jgi:hypothetical protein
VDSTEPPDRTARQEQHGARTAPHLIATQPFAKPKVGEQLYDTKIELEIQGENKRGYYRFHRRGVFVGYDIPVPAYTTSA